ncbi:hypothetical protein HDU93_001507 [Gonapodya sp. JEL0774]|nr:hypothetical protein HDU93_001507 [Gonapodya sp. JEL0774]
MAKDSFVIGAGGRVSVEEERRRREEAADGRRMGGIPAGARMENLKYEKAREIGDYLTKEEDEALQKEASFKKIKKKGKKERRTRTREDDDGLDAAATGGDVEMTPADARPAPDPYAFSNATRDTSTTNFVDDDDLQAALARQRRLAARKRANEQAVAAPEDVARMIKQEEEAKVEAGLDENGEALDGDVQMGGELKGESDSDDEDDAVPLVLSDTSEFVRNLPSVSVFQERQMAAERRRRAVEAAASASASADAEMPMKREEDEDIEEMDVEDARRRSGVGRWSPEDGDEEEEEEGDAGDLATRARLSGGGWTEAAEDGEIEGKGSVLERIEGGAQDGGAEGDNLVGIAEEPLVGSGLGAALGYLQSRGMIEKMTPENQEREDLIRKRARWAADQKSRDLRRKMEDQKRKEARREVENKKKKGGGGQQSYWEEEERAREEAILERQRARELEDKYKDYKPVVNIEYTNEFGMKMDQKEAFKYLSHRFHGKGSGKMKIEKRLLKIQEKLKEEAASSSAPIGTVHKMQEATKRLGQAHIVLQVGNRGVAPALPPIAGPVDPVKKTGASVSKVSKRKADGGGSEAKKAKR